MVNTVDDSVGGAMAYRRLRAPRRHGDALVEPSLAAAPDQVRLNRSLLAGSDADLHGRSLAELARSGRRELLELAQRYTSSYRSAPEIDWQQPVLLTGHQPEIFHPGVWFKNFALDALARRLSANAVNLIIDNDLPRSTSILCPQLHAQQARKVPVSFDLAGQYLPYEERGILDASHFETFGERVQQAIAPLIGDPLVREYWPLAITAARRTERLGLAIAQARHLWEQRWGLQTLEVPWSLVCDSSTFHWLAAHLLVELPRLHRDYNAALFEYRRLHRLRSRTHPVADLEEDGDWLEAPFWIWAEHDPHRRRMFVRRKQGCLELSDRRRLRACLPVSGDRVEPALESWKSIRASGIKIRPRALITTMYARLILSDDFVHGIGGAKYDQLTDEIIRRFLGIEPPSFMTVTATVCLPIERENVEPDDLRRLQQSLRELTFHPEKHAPADPDAEHLANEKHNWIHADLPAERLRERHLAITRVNELLQSWVQPVREKLLGERDELAARLHRARITNSREYAFCLFPEKTLRDELLAILQKHL